MCVVAGSSHAVIVSEVPSPHSTTTLYEPLETNGSLIWLFCDTPGLLVCQRVTKWLASKEVGGGSSPPPGWPLPPGETRVREKEIVSVEVEIWALVDPVA